MFGAAERGFTNKGGEQWRKRARCAVWLHRRWHDGAICAQGRPCTSEPSRFIPKRFNDSYLPKVGVTDRRRSLHSFRHPLLQRHHDGDGMRHCPADFDDERSGGKVELHVFAHALATRGSAKFAGLQLMSILNHVDPHSPASGQSDGFPVSAERKCVGSRQLKHFCDTFDRHDWFQVGFGHPGWELRTLICVGYLSLSDPSPRISPEAVHTCLSNRIANPGAVRFCPECRAPLRVLPDALHAHGTD
jgi:hypothetical protein